MALEKTKETDSGVSGNYWKIIFVKFHAVEGYISGQLAFFLSKEDRDSDKSPINGTKFIYHKTEAIYDNGEIETPAVLFTASDFDDENMIAKSYSLIKERNEFFGDATDV